MIYNDGAVHKELLYGAKLMHRIISEHVMSEIYFDISKAIYKYFSAV